VTTHPETRYQCNRCNVCATLPVQNTPVHTRFGGPSDWTQLVIGTDPSTTPSHLCDKCTIAFAAFMALRTPSELTS
jgi:hypothetical protein